MTTKTISMGEYDVVRSPDVLKTTLGSCVGIVLYDPVSDTFGLSHVMLPKAESLETAQAGKYVDTAIPALIGQMGTPKEATSRLKAKLAGGANMFSDLKQEGEKGFLKVGKRNIEAVKELLARLGIAVIGTDLGGDRARELTIDAGSGKIWVRPVGSKPKEF